MMRDALELDRMRARTIGLVPTMGALHKGHMKLIKDARMESDIVVASIFVNPAQFAPGEDYDKYPRDLDGDIEKLGGAGVDLLFMPAPEAMYPEGHEVTVDVGPIAFRLCGAFRPTHFSGVATVVAKLFNIIGPTRAYFGQKDYQQCVVIKKLVRDLDMPLEVVVCPTVREPDGLAMCSRNAYLTPQERSAAPVLFKALSSAGDFLRGGHPLAEARNALQETLASEPLVTEVQYADCYDPESLERLERFEAGAVIAGAIKLGKTRLIDNVLI